MPSDLQSRDIEKRENAAETIRRFFKDTVEVSNSNIVRNANNLLTDLPRNNDKSIAWIGTTEQRVDSGKFKLKLLILGPDDDETCWLPVTCLIVICSYFSLAELYIFRFVNKGCFSAVNSFKRFKKYLGLTNKIMILNIKYGMIVLGKT